MYTKIIVALLVAALPFVADAQLNGVWNKVKNKAKQRANNHIDKEIDKGLDEIEGAVTKKPEPVAEKPKTSKEEQIELAVEETGLKSFTKNDFIPGEHILYYDNFEGEALAELPTNWNTNGTGEVTNLDKYPGNWLRLHKPFIYPSSNTKPFGESLHYCHRLIASLFCIHIKLYLWQLKSHYSSLSFCMLSLSARVFSTFLP